MLLNKCCGEEIIQGPRLKDEVTTFEDSFLIRSQLLVSESEAYSSLQQFLLSIDQN